MLDRILFVLTFAAALGSGLIGGVFFGFSSFVMGALARLPPPQGIAAMQSINVVVLNPLFLGTFAGTALICLALAAGSLWRWSDPGSGYVLAGSLCYGIGTFLVTMVYNVPRNDALMKLEPQAVEAAAAWSRYVSEWTMGNHVRTVAGLVASALLIIGLIAAAGRPDAR